MSGLTRDGTAESSPARPNSQAITGARGGGGKAFSVEADHEQDWQPSWLMPSLVQYTICDDYTHTHTYCLLKSRQVGAYATKVTPTTAV